jgi:protein involved in polysaccharide export with SLBB domain
MADGATTDGDLSKVVLVRRGPNGQPVTRQIDLKQAIAKGKMEQNDLLSPGDVLYVGDKKKRPGVSGFNSLVWSMVGLATLFRF